VCSGFVPSNTDWTWVMFYQTWLQFADGLLMSVVEEPKGEAYP